VTKAMTSINPNRLHLLISSICGVVALAYGAHLLALEYSPFSANLIEQRQIKAIERNTGKPYAEWQKDRTIYCSKQEAESKGLGGGGGGGIFSLDPQGQREILYQACMNPIFESIPNAEIRTAFMKVTFPLAAAFAIGAIVASWLIGFLLTKAIPAGSNRLWIWLTSGGRSK